jgi:Tol biopolymer transport system component
VYDRDGKSPRVLAMRAPPLTLLQMRPAWSPEGKWLAAWSMSERAPVVHDLVTVSVDDRRERIITRQRLRAVDGMVWSADGSSVIVGAREKASSPFRLQRIPLDSPAMLPLTTNISDYRLLAYIDCEGGVANIWSRPLDGSPARRLTEFSSGHIDTFDWSPDGAQLAWITRSQVSDVVLIELPGGVPPS